MLAVDIQHGSRPAWLRAVLPPPIDQDCLLPRTRSLVGAVDASPPAACRFLPFGKVLAGPLNAASACLCLLPIIYPADELVSAERSQTFPKLIDLLTCTQRCLQVFTCLMDGTLRESAHEPSLCSRDPGQNGGFLACSPDADYPRATGVERARSGSGAWSWLLSGLVSFEKPEPNRLIFPCRPTTHPLQSALLGLRTVQAT